MLSMIIQDPVAWGSLLGLGVVLAICAYYVYMFVHHRNDKPGE